MTKQNFQVDYQNTKLIGDIMPADSKPKLLILHGSGSSNRSRYDLMRQMLADKGIASAAFDFIGHGETGGDLGTSSLHDRTLQAKAVIEQLNFVSINILGSSMGGYTAIKLLDWFEVQSLILAAPAVYSVDAYDLKFDPSFTNVIRNRINTDAWDILAKFKGDLLLYCGEKDDVIPKDITEKIYSSAILAKKEILKFPDVEHRINLYFQTHVEDLQKVIDKITVIIK